MQQLNFKLSLSEKSKNENVWGYELQLQSFHLEVKYSAMHHQYPCILQQPEIYSYAKLDSGSLIYIIIRETVN